MCKPQADSELKLDESGVGDFLRGKPAHALWEHPLWAISVIHSSYFSSSPSHLTHDNRPIWLPLFFGPDILMPQEQCNPISSLTLTIRNLQTPKIAHTMGDGGSPAPSNTRFCALSHPADCPSACAGC